MKMFYRIVIVCVFMALFPGVANLAFGASVSAEVQQNRDRLIDENKCRGCNLKGANLNRLDLTGADLSEADLTGATFFLSDLSEADLQRSILTGAQFGGADLSHANLTGADLREAEMSGAYMVGALLDDRFEEKKLTYDGVAENEEQDVSELDMKKQKEPVAVQQVAFSEKRDSEAALPEEQQEKEGLNVVQTVQKAPPLKKSQPVEEITLERNSGIVRDQGEETTQVVEQEIESAVQKKMQSAGKAKTAIGPAQSQSGQPVEKKISANDGQQEPGEKETPVTTEKKSAMSVSQETLLARLEDRSKCYQCDFSGIDLSGRDFGDVDLEGADFTGANLEGVDFDGANLKSVSFKNANLRNARMRNADLYKADFTGADLTGATFEGAKVDGTRFMNATGYMKNVMDGGQ